MILLIHKGLSSFIRRDYDILSAEFPVKMYHYNSKKGIVSNIAKQMKIFVWLLINIKKASALDIEAKPVEQMKEFLTQVGWVLN